ncbi:MAG TPA: CBS domain-containing protein [Gammaproteobacteria bacterium]|nr:CBS domain-containing protein [Gammaproteobacteria bacterium]
MKDGYKALELASVQPGARIVTPTQSLPENVTLRSPAIDVMTDLARVAAITIGPNNTMDDALTRMKNSGVRLLLVLNNEGATLGLITARDIQGERPVRFMRELGVAREDVLVRDIMTPRERLEAMWMRDVQVASVGDIIETLKRTGRQHAMVVERTVDGAMIRGLFSSVQIGRQLGVQIQQSGVAGTFSELEAALAH